MNENAAVMERVGYFFKLRTDILIFLGLFLLLMAVVYGVRWEKKLTHDDFKQLFQLELVELMVPTTQPQEQSASEAKVESLDNLKIEENTKEEEQEKEPEESFGDLSLNYGLSQINAFTAPKILTPPPAYPKALQKAGVQGTVLLKIGIDEKGKVVYGIIVEKVHPVLDSLILNWIKHANVLPARDASGKAIAVTMYFPARFSLESN